MDENLVQELQSHLRALMGRTRHSVAPIEGVTGSAARVLLTAARHCGGAAGKGSASGPDAHGSVHRGGGHMANPDEPRNTGSPGETSNAGVTPGHLAERLSMASSNVAAALRELEQAGYIERRRAAGDGRRVEVVLTPRGRDLVAAQRALRTDALRDVIHAALTAEEQAQLAAAIPLLGRLAASTLPSAPPPAEPPPAEPPAAN